ncbi:MAG: 50S ribosomal protein L1 [Candidatus Uhrbacteria bacterium]|nr:50S ribosomal protein L1 [Candidatus Uhrbacteria bacterium]
MTDKKKKKVKVFVDKNKFYALEDAVKLCKESASAKFDESIELAMNTGIDPKKGDQQIRGTVILPHGTGKTKRVIAFVDSANETAAKEAGADIIGTEEVIEEIIKKGTIDFDVAVAMPSMMPKLARAAKVLGPRGLMPNPKTDTVGPNIAKMIEEQKGGKVSFKNDNTSNVHATVGKASFDEAKLLENITTVFESVKKARPASSKGIYIKSAAISCTMGPGIKLDVSSL